jgi:hypothetical protein
MAHFAQIDENNIVINVIVVGDEYETMYADWRKEFGETYVQTSYNNRIRKQYAGIGYSYDPVADVFIAQKPYPSWFLNETHDWISPVPMPAEEGAWIWNEETQEWIR